ncbi:30S ribosomal protein S6 [Zavarzinella formosa]|uniref:30S ribosomal protein S6 n=1 Tax=Zavarzinella formosa TaxID=360055 RepID=UPI00036285F5|nr:30S ribosomal protein S6 [Zavarzinella formosa]
MPVNSYECLILLDPTKVTTDVEAAKAQIHATLEKYGSEIIVSRKWDDRKLAYPIDGHKKGLYYLVFFKVDSLKVTKIELDFRLSEIVLRHMVTVVDPKWNEELLAVAKDETKFGLQLLVEDASDNPMGEGDDMGDRHRRPRRNAEPEMVKD